VPTGTAIERDADARQVLLDAAIATSSLSRGSAVKEDREVAPWKPLLISKNPQKYRHLIYQIFIQIFYVFPVMSPCS